MNWKPWAVTGGVVGCGMLLATAALIGVLAAAFGKVFPSPRAGPSNEQVVQIAGNAREATLWVTGEKLGSDEAWQASATVFQSGDGLTLAWTNGHVVDDASESSYTLQSGATALRVYTRTGAAGTPVGHVLREGFAQRGLDLAMLVLPELGVKALPCAESPLRGGEWVLAVGNPLGETWFTDDGSVSAVLPRTGWSEFLHTATMEQGSSGGGVLGADGRLVGIQWGGLKNPRGGPSRGAAIDIASVTGLYDLHTATVAASGDWQETSIVPNAGQWLSVAAIGTYQLGLFVGQAGPRGRVGLQEYALDPALPFGCLLVKDNGPAIQVPELAYAQSDGGPLSFRVNDRIVSDNTGAMRVVVLIWRE